MEFFDCNCRFGLAPRGGLLHFPTAGELVAEMRFCGISRALVHHEQMRSGSPSEANQMLVKAVADQPELVPTWALLPWQTGEWDPERFCVSMQEAGVRALWAFPQEHRYQLNGLTLGPVLETMVQRRIPLFVQADWPLITSLLAEFPSLVLVATGHGPWGDDRYFRPLLQKYKHFYLDTANYELDWGLKDLCETYGPERLLFGTKTPERTMGGPMLTLLHAPLPEAAKEAIAHGNLERILGEVQL